MASRRIVRSDRFDGQVIRHLRKARNLSLEQLGDLTGMKKANLSKIERARSHIAIDYKNFLALARALYVAPEELDRRLEESPSSESSSSGKRRA